MILSAVLWLMLALGLVLAALLVLPVQLRLRAQGWEDGRLRLELGLLGGLVPWIAMVDTDRPAKRRAARPEKAAAKAGKRKARRGPGRARGMRMLRALPRLLGGLLRCIRIERARIDCTFGLGDPAETGQLYGQLAPALCVLPGGQHIVLRPDFAAARLDGEAELALAVIPATLLGPLLRFGWAVFGPRR